MKQQDNAPVTSPEQIDSKDLWVEVSREDIIETFKLTKDHPLYQKSI